MRRDELFGTPSKDDASSDELIAAELRARLNEQLSAALDSAFDFSGSGDTGARNAAGHSGPAVVGEAGEDANSTEQAFEFRLFRDEGPSHTVVLQRQEDEAGSGGFVVPKRPLSYYVAERPSALDQQRFDAAAVSVEDIIEDAGRRRWGLEKPWRVTTIVLSAKQSGEARRPPRDEAPEGPEKRRRPGKKRRIILRKRERARQEAAKAQQEEAERRRMEKEEHLKGKRKRLNRQKRLRRREKDKRNKLAARGTTVSDSEESSLDGQDSAD